MDEPDFDEDDLIDDYYDEEPHDAYEEFLEAAEAEKTSEPSETTPNDGANQQEPPQAPTATAIATTTTTTNNSSVTNNASDRMQVDRMPSTANDDDDDEKSNASSVNDFLSRQNTENDLYSFERYTSKSEWRREKPLFPSNTANTKTNNRKKRNADAMLRKQKLASMSSRIRKAPEARLMELMHSKNAPLSQLKIRHSSHILRSPVEGKQTQSITLADGARVYIQVKKKHLPSAEGHTTATSSSSVLPSKDSTTSLGVSIKELRRRSDYILKRQQSQSQTTSTSSTNNPADSQLWVDKHAPSSFPHLLSDERTNREVLRALRAWDPFVFGREPPVRPINYRQQQQNSENQQQPSEPENKLDKRPDEKNRVILLAGPPGVGKTTLAHIVARHAGYRPMEVNASDERSSSVLTDRVRRAMESTTINFNKDHPDYGRPNCLILDEIDGADAKGAVQALVDIIRAEIPPKGAKQKNTYLRRPIIFICNHKYAPSLRPLLPFARHFNVDSPSPARLVARLKAVLHHENMPMTATGSLLHQLVVASGGDIRSCMYTLQFASAQAKDSMQFSRALTTSLGGAGLKDHRNDVASTVATIFRKPKQGRIAGLRENDRASVTRVLDSAQGLGDSSALINSIFTNLLRVPYIDPTLDRCAVAHELLSSTDLNRFSGSIGGTDFGAPSSMAAIHLLCRVELKPDLSFSTREISDAQYRQNANLGLLHRFAEGLSPKCKSLKFQAVSLSAEVLPQLGWILSAGGGKSAISRASSSMDVLTVGERKSLEEHVGVLSALGLTYVVAEQEEQSEKRGNNYTEAAVNRMRLEPPIDRLGEFGNIKIRREIPSALKELIACEVRLQKIRRLPSNRTDNSPPKVEKPKSQATPSPSAGGTPNQKLEQPQARVTPSPAPEAKGSTTTPTKFAKRVEDLAMAAPAPKRLKSSQQSPVSTSANFLGLGAKKAKESKSARKAAAVGLVRSKKHKAAHTGSGFLLSEVVRLRYVKGFTQAVHTPCTLRDLE